MFVQYIKEKVTTLSMLSIFASFIGVLFGLDYLYKSYLSNYPESTILWAGIVTLVVYVFSGILNYCFFAQCTMKAEIDRITSVKVKLETQVLKKRQSPKKKH